MNIPKKFKLMGYEINVKFVEDLATEHESVGAAVYRQNEIRLQPSINGNPRSEDLIEHNFLHELTRFILYMMEEDKLRDNEKFVSVFSGLLHQALDTMEF